MENNISDFKLQNRMAGELTLIQIEDILTNNVFGRIGCYADGKINIIPITYAYDGESVIGYSLEGMKINMLRKNPRCCFEVDLSEGITNWQSVIAWGMFEELHGPEAEFSLQLLADKLKQLKTEPPGKTTNDKQTSGNSSRNGNGNKQVIYKIQLREKTGRFERL